MLFLLFLILCGICTPFLGLGPRANLIIGIVLLILGALAVFTGWDGFSVRVDN